MAQRKPRGQRLDGVDADHLTQTVASEGWQLIRQRIERTLELKQGELEQPLDPVRTATVRGEIAGLKLALTVPEILTAEAKRNHEERSATAN